MDDDRTFEYQATGLDVGTTPWSSLFAEYRLAYAQVDPDLASCAH